MFVWAGLLAGLVAVILAALGVPSAERRLALGLLGIGILLATAPRVTHQSAGLVLALSLLALVPLAGFVTSLARHQR
ncbi:MAG: hypothetical protein M3Y42_01535 [Actinomycetota bacterium]|nr:hypothetical protein [Actinomycetota bacterium]MDQ2955628.1 hypothetical protein [Actinomycetota bacterium]